MSGSRSGTGACGVSAAVDAMERLMVAMVDLALQNDDELDRVVEIEAASFRSHGRATCSCANCVIPM